MEDTMDIMDTTTMTTITSLLITAMATMCMEELLTRPGLTKVRADLRA